MKRTSRYLMLSLLLISCDQHEKSSWPQQHISEIKTIDPANTDYSDLEPLKKAIGSSKVVILSEQMHGDGSTYLANSRLVKFLHSEMDFKVLAFEADFFGMNKAWDDYKKGNKKFQDVLNQMYIFWSRSQMCQDLFETVEKSQNTSSPIALTGFDNRQISPISKQKIIPLLDSIINRHEIPLTSFDHEFFNSTLEEEMNVFYNQEISEDNQSRFLSILEKIFYGFKKQKVNSFWIQELKNIRGFMMHTWHWWIDREMDLVNNNYRDIQMANNVMWLLNDKYKGEKIIIWAATGHSVKTDTLYEVESEDWKPAIRQYPMGEVLHDSLSDEIYVIGAIAYEGHATSLEYNQARGDFVFKSKLFARADSGSLEFAFKQTGFKFAFLAIKNQSDPWLESQRRLRIWRPEYVKDNGRLFYFKPFDIGHNSLSLHAIVLGRVEP